MFPSACILHKHAQEERAAAPSAEHEIRYGHQMLCIFFFFFWGGGDGGLQKSSCPKPEVTI